ncbi:hypothetical protein SeMB42_g02008 [Synchytrium endobioticum]|uniref:Uncharacterized protein n=1 Tax=Synchytrium endobioticum TaxID=286115 RepID=A0A507DIY7_9FUNG|nr:hypothetical protein SeLEV6574_g04300 [Synchytrium endobioticum]TPX51225.1 hypothetical protein SeMB42_g02008 [Synchytrium endobioticum]
MFESTRPQNAAPVQAWPATAGRDHVAEVVSVGIAPVESLKADRVDDDQPDADATVNNSSTADAQASTHNVSLATASRPRKLSFSGNSIKDTLQRSSVSGNRYLLTPCIMLTRPTSSNINLHHLVEKLAEPKQKALPRRRNSLLSNIVPALCKSSLASIPSGTQAQQQSGTSPIHAPTATQHLPDWPASDLPIHEGGAAPPVSPIIACDKSQDASAAPKCSKTPNAIRRIQDAWFNAATTIRQTFGWTPDDASECHTRNAGSCKHSPATTSHQASRPLRRRAQSQSSTPHDIVSRDDTKKHRRSTPSR